MVYFLGGVPGFLACAGLAKFHRQFLWRAELVTESFLGFTAKERVQLQGSLYLPSVLRHQGCLHNMLFS